MSGFGKVGMSGFDKVEMSGNTLRECLFCFTFYNTWLKKYGVRMSGFFGHLYGICLVIVWKKPDIIRTSIIDVSGSICNHLRLNLTYQNVLNNIIL